jgi:NTE family protein
MRSTAKSSLTLASSVLLSLLAVSSAHSQSTDAVALTDRPRVGLVLGGGGAKGAAHIGVLRVLEELRVPIDCVAGTSMGALVGATFAAGVAPADIESAVLAIDWSETVGGQGRCDQMPIERKLSGVTYSNNFEFGIRDGSLTAPAGIFATQAIENRIRTLVSRAWFTESFDDLPIPFRAVATDMLTGDMVVLDSGPLADAMRASMAIPGAFAPVRTDGRILSDGGLMRNLPVDVARELCADVVIAVWLSTTPPNESDLSSAFAILQRSVAVMIGANQTAQIATLTERDVGIGVQMGDLRTEEFERVPEAIELGRSAALANAGALRQFAVSERDYVAWEHAIGRAPETMHTVAEVRVVGLDRVNPEYVRSQFATVLPGEPTSAVSIADNAARVFAAGDFERVDYELLGPEDARVLEVQPVEKSWGPDFLTFDLGLSTSAGSDFQAIIRADHNRTWVNPRGGRWHNVVQIGRQSVLQTDFFQPLDMDQRFFVHSIARAENAIQDVYLFGDRVAQYSVRQLYAQADVGTNIGTRAQIRFGLRSGVTRADLDTGSPGLPEAPERTDSAVLGRLVYDTRDSVGLPTRGSFVNARWVKSTSSIGGELDYELVEAAYAHAFNIRGDSLSLIVGGAETLSGDLPIMQEIQIGGIRTFPGLRPGELRGDSYRFGGVRYSWLLRDLQPLLGQALYAGLSLQAGRVGGRIDEVAEETIYGIAGSLGGRTSIGPFQLSLGIVEDRSWELQFTVGLPVDEGSILDELY